MQRRHFLISAAVGPAAASLAKPRALSAESTRWPHDGAATIARLGVLTPDFDPVPESELSAMAPLGFSIHGARVPRTGGRGAGFVAAPFIDVAVDGLVELAPRAILLGYTSSSYMLGAEADERARARLEQRAKGIPFVFTCAAAAAALRQLRVQRISLVHPPWWTDEVSDRGAVYWRAMGFDVVDCTRLQPSRSFTEVSAAEVFDYVSRRTPRSAEAVFIGGNGMRSIGAVRALEARLRRPVLSSNQVLLWEALRRFGRADAVTGYGSIFGRGARTS